MIHVKEKEVRRELLAQGHGFLADFVPASSIKDAAMEGKYFYHFTVGDLIGDLSSLETIKADQPIREALRKMCTKKYSQLPVIQGKNCIGAVTLESILTLLAREDAQGNVGIGFMDWPVRRFVDDHAEPVQIEDDLLKHVEVMAEKGFVIVGSGSNLESLVTNYDLVHFFKEETEIFLMLREIETCLRFIVRKSLSKRKLMEALHSIKRKEGSSPSCTNDLSFDELRQLICGNWKPLKRTFSEKEKIDKQLIKIRDLRNRVFHFRDQVTKNEFDFIKKIRDNCIRLAYSKTRKTQFPRLE